MGDLIGALAGYIGGKDARVTGQIAALPVYKGKLEKPPADKPKELTEKQKQLNAYLSKYKSGGDGGGEEQRKKKKRKVRKGEEPGRGLKIIDEDRGLGGISLAKAKGALRVSDEELSDERAVTVEEEELEALKAAADREKNFSSVQVDDGGSGGTNWVTVDQDGNIVNDAAKSKSASAADRDLSPPRRRGGGVGGVGGGDSADQSPPRRTGGGIKRRAGDSGSDQSPPRARAASGRGGARRHDSDSDASPPRRRVPSGDRDQSPPRRVRGDAGAVPARLRGQGGADLSPPRRTCAGRRVGTGQQDPDSDEGVVRAPQGEDGASKVGASPPRRRRHDSDSEEDDAAKKSVNTRTVNGLKAGFVSGQELRDTMEKKKEKESERFNKLDDAVTGKVAETVSAFVCVPCVCLRVFAPCASLPPRSLSRLFPCHTETPLVGRDGSP